MKRYLLLLFLIVSCSNGSDNDEASPPQTDFEQPLIQPLQILKEKQLNPDTIKAKKVFSEIRNLDIKKLSLQSYDTIGFKPLPFVSEENKFDYNSLPEKDFDIDRLPSKPLQFKTYALPPPVVLKVGAPRLKNSNLSLHDLQDSPILKGIAVTFVFNDKDGFLWIATVFGDLYRYDGENLLSYSVSAEKSPVYNMVQDKKGRIWMSENIGIFVLDIANGVLKITGQEQLTKNNAIIWLVKDDQERIWATFTEGGIDIIDPSKETVRWLNQSNGLSSKSACSDVAEDKNNYIWLSMLNGGVNIIDLNHKKIKYLNKTNYLKNDSVSAAILDHQGRIWLASRGGLRTIVDTKKASIQYLKEAAPHPASIYLFYPFSDGTIWCCTTKGLEIIDTKTLTAKRLPLNKLLNGTYMIFICEDNCGQRWIAMDTGLGMISDDKAIVDHLDTAGVSSLAEDKKGLIWLATQKGINIIDRKTKTFRHVQIAENASGDSISIIKQVNGSIFIGSNNGVYIIDSTQTTLTRFFTEKRAAVNKIIKALLVDKQRRIWVGGPDEGVDIYYPDKKIFKHIGVAQGLYSYLISDIKQDRNGLIWLSTANGVVDVVDPDTWKVKDIKTYFENSDMSLLPDDRGNVWVGVQQQNVGIKIINLTHKTLSSFSTFQGLIDNNINSLLLHKCRIYAGTDKGITIITPPGNRKGEKWKTASFGRDHGVNKLQTHSFESDLITIDEKYFWGDKGISVLDLSKVDSLKQTVFITGINVMDRPANFKQHNAIVINAKDNLLDQNNNLHRRRNNLITGYANKGNFNWGSVTGPYNLPVNLQLRYNQNFIRFSYGSLNLTDHDSTQYEYKLVGVDKNWVGPTVSMVSNNYFSLNPGSYMFKVAGKSFGGVWSKPATFSFIITPPWWQTWWAYVLYIVSFACIIWAFVYLRSRQLVKEKEVLEHQVQMRTDEILQQKEEIETQRDHLEMEKIRSNIAADFHDELGSTLSSIALYSEMAINSNSADERTKNILSLIGESSRGTVSAMQDMIWTIQPKNDKMQEVVFRMQEYAYPLAELKNIAIKFDVADEVLELVLPMDIRKNIYLIFKEGLNNAFKYAAASAISIKIVKKENSLKMDIKDNGKGFDLISQKKGNGLNNMQKRAEQAGATLIIESKPGSGTAVFFNCPVS